MVNMIKLAVVEKLPPNIGIGSRLEVMDMRDNEIVLSPLKEEENFKIIKRRDAIMKLRKKVGAPLNMNDYKPLTKDEIHED